MARPARIFISYAHTDKAHLERLAVHLESMRRDGIVQFWHDGMIEPGARWEGEIDCNLENADIVILLVSADFVASDYCYQKELMLALDKHRAGRAQLVPIIVEPCDWTSKPFGALQALPTGGHPVSLSAHREQVWSDITLKLRAFVDSARNTGTQAPQPVENVSSRGFDNYRPYPRELIERLDELTADRARRRSRDETLERKIQDLVREISSNYRSARIGDVVLGATLIEVIGSGAFGDVWRARPTHGAVRDDIAIKIFQSAKVGLGRNLHAFRVGVTAMERLAEDNRRPAEVIELKASDESKTAFAMNLAQRLDLEDAGCDWSLEHTLRFFRGVCSAVKFSHLKDIRHRDIKPKNVLVTSQLTPVLTDFDIADLMFKRTMSVAANGTPTYAAPEQLKGHRTRAFNADVYSLGRLLHFMLLRSDPPWEDAIPRLDDLRGQPEGLVRIVRKCTMRDPAARYQTVGELLSDLDRYDKASHAVGCSVEVAREHNAERIVSQADVRLHAASSKASEATSGGEAFARMVSGGDVDTAHEEATVPARAQLGRAGARSRTRVLLGVPSFTAAPSPEPKHSTSASAPESTAPASARRDRLAKESEALELASPLQWDDEDELLTPVYDKPVSIDEYVWSSPLESVEKARPSTSDAQLPPPIAASDARAESSSGSPPTRGRPMLTAVVVVLSIIGAIAGGLAAFGAKEPGTLSLSTRPSRVEVSVDGHALGSSISPFVIGELTPSRPHEISISSFGHRPWSKVVTLSPGQVLTLPEVTLEPIETGFKLVTEPPGATVFVDERELPGHTPLRVTDLSPGEHRVRVELAGYADWASFLVTIYGTVLPLPTITLNALPSPEHPSWVTNSTPRPRSRRSNASKEPPRQATR